MKLIQKLLLGVFLASTLFVSFLGAETKVQAATAVCPWWTFDYSACQQRQEESFITGQANSAALICTRFKNSDNLLVATLNISNQAVQAFGSNCKKVFTYSTDGKSVVSPEGVDSTKYTTEQRTTLSDSVLPLACGFIEGAQKNQAIQTEAKIALKTLQGFNTICNLSADGQREYVESQQANANPNPGCGADVICVLKAFVTGLAKGIMIFLAAVITVVAAILSFLASFILQILSLIANELLLINPASNQYIGVSRSVFGIFLNLVNLVIVFLFVKTGISFIFDDKKNPDISSFVITVATIAIGVQFSFALAAAVMALSYNIGYIFLQTVSPGSINPFTAFFDAVNNSFNANVWELAKNLVATMGAYIGQIFGGEEPKMEITGTLLGAAAIHAVRLFIFLVGIWVMWSFVTKFAIRAATMFFLLITAPVGFVFLIATDLDKDLKKFGDEWWKGLIANSLVYPIIVIALAIGARLVVQITALNSGQNISTEGFDLFNTATYSIILAPMIQTILPGVVALATLYLISQWVEDNLKSSMGGIAGKLVQMAGKGANLATNAYRKGVRYGTAGAAGTAGLVGSAASRIGANLESLTGGRLKISGQGAAASQRIRNLFDRKTGKPEKEQKVIDAAAKMREKQKNTTFKQLAGQSIKNGIKAGNIAEMYYSSEGRLNPVNRLMPYRATVDKNGNWGYKLNEESVLAQQYGAVAAQAKGEAHAYAQFQSVNGDWFRELPTLVSFFDQQGKFKPSFGPKGAVTEAERAAIRKADKQSGMGRTNLTGLTKRDLERMASTSDEKRDLRDAVMTQTGLDAANRYLGNTDKEAIQNAGNLVASMSDAVDPSAYDLQEQKSREQYFEMAKRQWADPNGVLRYGFRAILDDPKRYKNAIQPDSALKTYIQTADGVEDLINNMDEVEDVQKIQTLLSAANGLIGFSDDEINKLRDKALKSNNDNLALIANHIQSERIKLQRDAASVDRTVMQDRYVATAAINEANKDGVSLLDLSRDARKASIPGLAITPKLVAEVAKVDFDQREHIISEEFKRLLAAQTTAPNKDVISREQVLEAKRELISAVGRANAAFVLQTNIPQSVIRKAEKLQRKKQPVIDASTNAPVQELQDELLKSMGAVIQGNDIVFQDLNKLAKSQIGRNLKTTAVPELKAAIASGVLDGDVSTALLKLVNGNQDLRDGLVNNLIDALKKLNVSDKVRTDLVSSNRDESKKAWAEALKVIEKKGLSTVMELVKTDVKNGTTVDLEDATIEDIITRATVERKENQMHAVSTIAHFTKNRNYEKQAVRIAEEVDRDRLSTLQPSGSNNPPPTQLKNRIERANTNGAAAQMIDRFDSFIDAVKPSN